jgi:hypothetical protein
MGVVHCRTHGEQPRAYVCQHIAYGLINRQRVGFFWCEGEPDSPEPNAWCLECENRWTNEGGEWVGAAQEHLELKVLCRHCYDFAKAFHLGAESN